MKRFKLFSSAFDFLWGAVQLIGYEFAKFAFYFSKSQKIKLFLSYKNFQNWKKEIRVLEQSYAQIFAGNSERMQNNLIWVHVASAGELEQVIPILNFLHQTFHKYFFLTYFSPSAIPFVGKIEGLAHHTGFPRDEVKFFAEISKQVNFSKIIFVRYDLWPSFIEFFYERKTPIFLTCATRRRTKNTFLNIFSEQFRTQLFKKCSHIFAVEQFDFDFFIGILNKDKVSLTGDSKWFRAFERALIGTTIAQQIYTRAVHQEIAKISADIKMQKLEKCARLFSKLVKRNILFIASPHQEEFRILKSLYSEFSVNKENVLFVCAPHDVSRNQIEPYLFDSNCYLFSRIHEDSFCNFENLRMLIIDEVGFLAESFAICSNLQKSVMNSRHQAFIPPFALIGGGFDGQIHNVLEAAAGNSIVLSGNQLQRAAEAVKLAEYGASLTFENVQHLFEFIKESFTLFDGGLVAKTYQIQLRAEKLFESASETIPMVAYTIAQNSSQRIKAENE